MAPENLLPVSETLLPVEPDVVAALAAVGSETGPLRAVVAAHPRSSLAWATLADATFGPGAELESYAYARVGYHRGLDALRKAGWRGSGPVPWSHEPNRGVLRAIFALRRAAEAIGETDEVERLTTFLNDCDPTVVSAIEPSTPDAPPTEAIVIRGFD